MIPVGYIMVPAIVVPPFVAGLAAFFTRSDAARRALLVTAACFYTLVSAATWAMPAGTLEAGKWFCVDEQAKLFLGVTSLLFLTASTYAVGYLKREGHEKRRDIEEGFIFRDAPEAVFAGCLLVFLSAMSLVIISRHFGILWVGMEATTLASAPLIYFHRHHRSLEAVWKYLLICSVGIALALVGNVFLAISGSYGGERIPLFLEDLTRQGAGLNGPCLKVAFIFLLVGYGTKMGLAPMHTWLPDAHSEAPSVVSALLSGALLNSAFLCILRVHQVMYSAAQSGFSGGLLVKFGLISMGVAAVFILGQTDFKRMLAYSSVEHMGILALGVGLGGGAVFGAMFHVVNHSVIKAMLFFTAGNILAAYKTKNISGVKGALRVLPYSGILWTAGFLAIVGMPPFGTFISEFIILKAALDSGRFFAAAFYLAILLVIFAGIAKIVLSMVQGTPGDEMRTGAAVKESLTAVLPPAVLCAVSLLLGLYMPAVLRHVLAAAARAGGGA